MIFTKKRKITAKYFLNSDVKPVIRSFGTNGNNIQEHYALNFQVTTRNKNNKKKSLFYKYEGLNFKNDIFYDHYIPKNEFNFYLDYIYKNSSPGFLEQLIERERNNIIYTISLANHIPDKDFTLSNYSEIHELVSKTIIELLEPLLFQRYYKDNQGLGVILYNNRRIFSNSLGFGDLYQGIHKFLDDLNSPPEIIELLKKNIESPYIIYNALYKFCEEFERRESLILSPTMWAYKNSKIEFIAYLNSLYDCKFLIRDLNFFIETLDAEVEKIKLLFS